MHRLGHRVMLKRGFYESKLGHRTGSRNPMGAADAMLGVRGGQPIRGQVL
jgi:hypothetical protein